MDFTARLYAAAAKVPGMLDVATVTLPDGATMDVPVGFSEPTEIVLGGEVIADAPAITFPIASLPDLKRRTLVFVAGRSWKVKSVERLADGTEARATLEKP